MYLAQGMAGDALRKVRAILEAQETWPRGEVHLHVCQQMFQLGAVLGVTFGLIGNAFLFANAAGVRENMVYFSGCVVGGSRTA